MTELVLPRVFPFAGSALPYSIELMRPDDLDQVMPIERASFPAPWPASAYRYELTQNALSSYLVLRQGHLADDPRRARLLRVFHKAPVLPILGYGGFWIILDEGHISTIAIHPDWRGQGLGEMMLVALMDAAIASIRLRSASEKNPS